MERNCGAASIPAHLSALGFMDFRRLIGPVRRVGRGIDNGLNSGAPYKTV